MGTVTHNITRQEDFEGTPGGTIGSTGGGPGAGAEAGLHYEGAQCLARRIGSTNTDVGFDYAHDDIGTVNMTTTGFHVWLCKVFTALSAVINPAGTKVGIGDADGSMYKFQVGDDGTMGDFEDFALPRKGGYVVIPIEARVNAWHNETREATPDITIADTIELLHNVSATTGAGTSQALDSIDYTTDGLFLTGASSVFQDFVDADEGAGVTGASAAGIWASSPAGIIFYLTNTIGRTDAGTTTATTFSDSGFALTCPGGFVSDGRNGLFFDLGNASTSITMSDGSIAGAATRFGGRTQIKRYFDTELDVNGTTNVITIVGHGFNTGDAVIYSAEGGTEDIGPDATTGEAEFNNATAGAVGTGPYWYVISTGVDTIQLAATAQAAYAATPTATSLTASTAGNGENHSLTRRPDTRPNIEFTGTAGTATLTRVNFILPRIMTLTSVCTLNSCVISQGRQLILGDATLNSCIIAGPTTSIGEAYLQATNAIDLNEIDGSSFTSGGLGHAIEITTDGGTVGNNTCTLVNVGFSDYFANDEDATGGWSFNASTDVTGGATDTIGITGHGFSTGDAVYYSDEGGTAITELTDQALYYVRSVDANTVALYLSDSAAIANSNRISLTPGVSETHKLYSANATIFNNTGADVTINISGGSTPTIRNGTGSTTTVVQSVTLTLTGIETDSEVNITNLDDTTNFDKTLASSEQIVGELVSVSIANGGTGYTNGTQTLTLVGGTFTTAAQVSVEVVGGVVTSINSITIPGSYTLNPTNPVSTTGGGGTGATLNCEFAGEFQYSYDAANAVNAAIVVFHLDFVEVRIVGPLPTTSSTIPIQQRGDRVYSNP
jgi:hypothetical protein